MTEREAVQEWSSQHPLDLHSLSVPNTADVTYRSLAPGIYSGQPLASAALRRFSVALDARIAAVTAAGLQLSPPNSMNQYGAILDDLGFGPWVSAVVAAVVEPFAQRFFPEVAECGLDAHHAFIVEYSPETDDRLSWHVDDAEVTLNLCLGDVFEGGDLVFRGRRCARHRDSGWSSEEVTEVAHVTGTAILHAGADRHEALPVTSGYRRNLIIWCQSTCYRERMGNVCPEWCPDHGRALRSFSF